MILSVTAKSSVVWNLEKCFLKQFIGHQKKSLSNATTNKKRDSQKFLNNPRQHFCSIFKCLIIHSFWIHFMYMGWRVGPVLTKASVSLSLGTILWFRWPSFLVHAWLEIRSRDYDKLKICSFNIMDTTTS